MKKSFSSLQYSYDNMEDPSLREENENNNPYLDEELDDPNKGYSQEELDRMSEDLWVNNQVRKGLM